MQTMTSSRPYLIRALYDWITDNQFTPHLLVNATADEAVVPQQYVKDGKIILNLSPTAVQSLELGNELIQFSARFSGVAMSVSVPVHAALAIYAAENGQGMVFSDDGSEPPPPKDKDKSKDKKSDRPSLKVVK